MWPRLGKGGAGLTTGPMTTEPMTTGPGARPGSDPERTADAAALDALLRCWVRENALAVPAEGPLVWELPLVGVRLVADLVRRSEAGFHRFANARIEGGAPLTATAVAALLATQAAGEEAAPGNVVDLVGRVADSQARVAEHLRCRAAEPEDPAGTTPFLAAEQALVLGHPLHPTPKSRAGLGGADAAEFSPELRGSFALHWFAADPSVVSSDGAAVKRLAEFAPELPDGQVPVPAHPWQAREVRARPEIRRMLDEGLLRDLGAAGEPWFPTASLRTVYRPDAAVMLKFSLGLPITNSRRENLHKELRRGVEIDRLLRAGLEAELAAAHPGFGIVRDPAWLAVGGEDGANGLELVVRDNPFGPDDRVACVAGLVAERPDVGRAQLTALVEDLVARTGRSAADVAHEWCGRYFDAVIAPVLWLYREFGLGLEAHQQNTVVVLDEQGWPVGGWYRDNQGYYLSESRVAELERFLPEIGIAGQNRVPDEVIDERLGYYIGLNNLVGLVGAFGNLGLAAERGLLDLLRQRLRGYADLPLAATLAEQPVVRCKANLLTRVGGMDELVGPLETQSVYRDVPNPLVGGQS